MVSFSLRTHRFSSPGSNFSGREKRRPEIRLRSPAGFLFSWHIITGSKFTKIDRNFRVPKTLASKTRLSAKECYLHENRNNIFISISLCTDADTPPPPHQKNRVPNFLFLRGGASVHRLLSTASHLASLWNRGFGKTDVLSVRSRRIGRVGRSKLIKTKLTVPDIEIFMNLTHVTVSLVRLMKGSTFGRGLRCLGCFWCYCNYFYILRYYSL